MLNRLNSLITAFLALAGFLWLSWYAWHHEAPAKPVTLIMRPDSQAGYSVADRAAMEALLAKVRHEKRLSKNDAQWLLTEGM